MLDEQLIDDVIVAAKNRILAHQNPDGSFSYFCEVTPLSDAIMVIFLNLIGYSADPLIPELCQTLARRQRPDGGWSVYPGQDANLSATTLAYFALLLSGFAKTLPLMMKARACILKQGGITGVSSFTKVFLAVAGQIPWSSLPNSHIEVVLWEPSDPISLFDLSSPARLHLPSIMLLTHLNFSYSLSQNMSLADLVGHDVELPKHRIPLRNERAIERCHSFLLDRVEPNGTLAGYLSSTVFMVFALQAYGYPSHHPHIVRAILGLKDMVYRGKLFVHQQFFTSEVWDTSLSLQVLTAAGAPPSHEAMAKGASYLLSRQQHLVSDWRYHSPQAKPGGWGFSNVNTLYPDVDDTIAAVRALYPFRHMAPSQWKRGAKWALVMQNDDGGWSAFDRNCNKEFLKFFAGDDLKQALADPSTPDITGRVLETIGVTRISASKAVSRGVNWLLNQQRDDGSWFGRWGIAFIYGTWATLQGLRASGMPTDHPSMRKALSWLESVQNPDGGFGESCQSDEREVYVPLKQSTASQTAWALMGMISASGKRTPSIERAAQYLVATARPHGGWRERYPTGAGIAGQAYIRYHSYPYIWPLMALCFYRKQGN